MKMRNIFRVLGAAALAIFAFQVQAASDGITRQVRVNEDFIEGKIISIREAPRITYRFTFIVVNNVVELCAAYYVSSASSTHFDDFLRDSALEVNDQKVIKDFRFWNRVSGYKLIGQMANCKSTGLSGNTKVRNIEFAWSKRLYRM